MQQIRKGLSFILLFLVLIFSSPAQGPQFEWARRMGGPGSDLGKAVAFDAAGNIFSTGYFCGSVDFDPGPGVYFLTSKGARDLFVQKLDPNGNLLWVRSFGGVLADEGASIAVDPEDNVVITGSFQDSVNFNPGPRGSVMISNGGKDIFVLALGGDGHFRWVRGFGGPGIDMGISIATGHNGALVVTGSFEETVDFDPGPENFPLVSKGAEDAFIVRLDAEGNFLFAGKMGGIEQFDCGTSVALDEDGNIFVTGRFRDVSDLDPGPGALVVTAKGVYDIFILKLDPQGHLLWVKCIGGPGWDEGHSIAIDSEGNPVIAGTFQYITDFDPGPSAYFLNGGLDARFFILKLDPDGNFRFAFSLEEAQVESYCIPLSVAVDPAGNIYATGFFADTIDFDPGPEEYVLIADFNPDIFVLKVSPLGDFLWAGRVGGIYYQEDQGRSIAIDPLGNIYLTGYFEGMEDFDPGEEMYYLTAVGEEDIFITKWTQAPDATADQGLPYSFQLFPNPTTGTFMLDLGAIYQDVKIEVTALNGQVVQQWQLAMASTLELTIDTPPGMYFLQISIPGGQKTTCKIIRQ
ncbi:MAG: SBBP repeat-containing protein [Lewinellaceae bacterium]|nr:SBBP repeat-containing protein [Lewinellaceae bacterium]